MSAPWFRRTVRDCAQCLVRLGFLFLTWETESVSTPGSRARDTVDIILHCPPFTFQPVGGFIRLSAGPSRKTGKQLLDTIPGNFPHRHATSVQCSGNSA